MALYYMLPNSHIDYCKSHHENVEKKSKHEKSNRENERERGEDKIMRKVGPLPHPRFTLNKAVLIHILLSE